MGNYLQRLAARALGQTVSVQPRVPSLFEPPSASLATLQGSVIGAKRDLSSSVRTAEAPPQPAPANVVQASASGLPLFSMREQGAVRQQMQQAANVAARSFRAQRDDPTPHAPAAKIEGVEQMSPDLAFPSRLQARVKSTQIEHPKHKPEFREARTDAALPPQRMVHTKTGHLHPSQEPESTLQPLRSPRLDPERQPAFSQSVSAPVSPLISSAFHQTVPAGGLEPQQPAQTSDSAPSVNVIIGKVSVHAVTPAPVVPRPPSPLPGPSLTLEQYLKQRAGVS